MVEVNVHQLRSMAQCLSRLSIIHSCKVVLFHLLAFTFFYSSCLVPLLLSEIYKFFATLLPLEVGLWPVVLLVDAIDVLRVAD